MPILAITMVGDKNNKNNYESEKEKSNLNFYYFSESNPPSNQKRSIKPTRRQPLILDKSCYDLFCFGQ
jgi:hypothetical protein